MAREGINIKDKLDIAVIGAGPVGLALAVHAARALPSARITLFDARVAEGDVSRDARTLALSLASVQMLERLGAWNSEAAQPILEVHVSQQGPSIVGALGAQFGAGGEPELRISASEEGVPLLGAVLRYGAIVEPLQRGWAAAAGREPQRLSSRFATPVTALKNRRSGPSAGVELDTSIVESFDLAVVAEGGVFADQARKALARDYRQTAWVGRVTFAGDCPPGGAAGVAFERFTRQGPAALLPLKDGSAALVWCVSSPDDPVRELDDRQRIAVLNQVFHPSVGRIATISPLKAFPLGLNAERTLTDGRIVRVGNAAQTLHPVAGQGLNLGLRDAHELVHALSRSSDLGAVLRKLEWQRAPDRWAMIAATDFLARSFTWAVPGAASVRALGLAALQRVGPLKSVLARQMMFGNP
jgi:2-octaprenyl-6-methoxyphenol hydroxylase